MMQHRVIGTIIGSILIGLASLSISQAATEVEVLNLPEGDELRGRQVFQVLKCNACHLVAGDAEMKDFIAAKPGPVVGLKQSTYKSHFLAQSIIDPSHAIAPGFKEK